MTSCVFARDVRRKKRARQRLLRRQTELRERRAMLRRVARRLAEDAAQYAKLAEATDDGSDGRFEASGGPVGGSGDGDGAVGGGARMYAGNRAGIGVRAHGRRERSGLGSGAAAQDDVGMVEIARSPRYSPRYSPGPNGVAARGWRGPGSYREYLGSNPDGDGNDPGFGAGFGSVQGRARVASSSFPASGARTPARIASARAAAAAAAAAAVAAAAAKLAALTGQQLQDAEAQISSDYSDEEEDAAGDGSKGGGVQLDRRPRSPSTSPTAASDVNVAVDAAGVDVGPVDVAVDVDAGSADVAVDVAASDLAADDFDTITVGGPRGSSYRVSDAGGLDGAPDLGDAELEALYTRSYERALMRAEAERAARAAAERAARAEAAAEAESHRGAADDGSRVTFRLPNAATRATRFAPPGGETRVKPPRPSR